MIYRCPVCKTQFTSKTERDHHISTDHKERAKPYGRVKSVFEDEEPDRLFAKTGFHGYVNHPTHFIVGEHGRERVDIYPKWQKGYKIHHRKHHQKHDDNPYDVSKFFEGKF